MLRREGCSAAGSPLIQVRTSLGSKSTAAALAAVTLPVPLHLAGHHHRAHPAGHLKAPAHVGPGKSGSHTRASVPGPPHRRHSASSHRKARHHRFGVPLAIKAHAAGDPGDTISDYKFTPATLTIHAGDTVVWTNNGPSEHSATANNGSFNTGLLAKGASASHTFTTPGTYTYVCIIHPFMHGTVVVLASTTTPTTTPTTPGASTTPASTTPTSTSSGPALPMTGLDLVATLLCGFLLGGVGLALRRPVRGAPQPGSGEGRNHRQ